MPRLKQPRHTPPRKSSRRGSEAKGCRGEACRRGRELAYRNDEKVLAQQRAHNQDLEQQLAVRGDEQKLLAQERACNQAGELYAKAVAGGVHEAKHRLSALR